MSQSKDNDLDLALDLPSDLDGMNKLRGHDLIAKGHGTAGDDISDNTYDELRNTMSHRGSYPPSRVVDHFASLAYEALHLASSDANIIEIIEPALETTGIDLPNGSFGDVEDDIDAMDSVSQAGDNHGEGPGYSHYSWQQTSKTTMPDLTNTFPHRFPRVDNETERKVEGARYGQSIVNSDPLKRSLSDSAQIKHTKQLTFPKDKSKDQEPGDITNDSHPVLGLPKTMLIQGLMQ